MASSLLRILAAKNLPMVVEGGDLVDAVHILVLGGHVEARMEKAVRTADGWRRPSATVTRVTPAGRRMVRLFPPAASARP